MVFWYPSHLDRYLLRLTDTTLPILIGEGSTYQIMSQDMLLRFCANQGFFLVSVMLSAVDRTESWCRTMQIEKEKSVKKFGFLCKA